MTLTITNFPNHSPFSHLPGHNTHCLPPSPPKFCLTFVFHFFLCITAVPREIENNAYAKFWGQTRCIMGDGQMANWILSTYLCSLFQNGHNWLLMNIYHKRTTKSTSARIKTLVYSENCQDTSINKNPEKSKDHFFPFSSACAYSPNITINTIS